MGSVQNSPLHPGAQEHVPFEQVPPFIQIRRQPPGVRTGYGYNPPPPQEGASTPPAHRHMLGATQAPGEPQSGRHTGTIQSKELGLDVHPGQQCVLLRDLHTCGPTNWLGLRSERVRDARGHKRGGRVGCGARASAAATCAYAHNTTTAATSRHIVILEPSPMPLDSSAEGNQNTIRCSKVVRL